MDGSAEKRKKNGTLFAPARILFMHLFVRGKIGKNRIGRKLLKKNEPFGSEQDELLKGESREIRFFSVAENKSGRD